MTLGLVFSLLLGYIAGGLANLAADVLPHAGKNGPAIAVDWRRVWFFAPDPSRRLWLGVAVMLAFGVTYMRFQATPLALAAIWLYTAFLLTVMVIDLEHRRVLNLMLAPAAPAVLLLSLLPGMPGLWPSLLGGLAGFGMFVLLHLIGRGKLGAGDVKLAGVIGLMVGYPAVWTALLAGTGLGALVALLLLVTRRAGLKSTFAYAPYLAAGGIAAFWIHFPM